MKTLIIAPSVLNAYGGPSTVANNVLKGFVKIDEVLSRNDVEITFLSIGDAVSKKITGNIEVLGTKRFPLRTFTGEIQALLKKIDGFDLVHSHNLYEVVPYLLSGTPTVFTLHGIFWKEKNFNKGYAKPWLKLLEYRLRLYYPRLSKLVAISWYVLDELKSRNFDTSKTVIIENPVSEEFFNVKKREEDLILYPATLIPRKNQLGFLKAVSLIKEELKDYKVVFTASGDRDYEKMLRKFVKENRINAEFLGKIPYDKVIELYSKASVVALTSFQETLPMAVLESLATGTPVICSNVGGIPYAVKNGETGVIVDPYDPRDIAEKLLMLLGDETLRKRLGRRAKKEALKRWRAEVIARKHLDLYLKLLGGDGV
ncbi:glycosyltransferase family 4 protein [Thermococcus waiotapuensis]|uniref:Glycosyltransferase family 4 protein n=1 Tax=Thermococcus waiotapuensis TaxID=90909 RepID=A0AAE4T1C9_9EURY|nr:glycosyltransferase family 4 protein [Thermococcus waiotapuensis]MDV3104090.1 glycosyltransferase family 4 protein [Thermococcus waiotapuensis]